ncbi:MAG TPA: hypothetical protein VJ227_02570 [Patescibacteria group bacterium]|nr:hypothetical protein [Patescibacteria group bacterium]
MEKTHEPSAIAKKIQQVKEDVSLAFNLPVRPDVSFLRFYEELPPGRGKAVSKAMKENLARVDLAVDKGWASEREDFLLTSEYRAINYLYGDAKSLTESEVSENPLVDLLILVAGRHKGGKPPSEGGGFQLAVEGPPERQGIFEGQGYQRREQYSYETDKRGRKVEFRTLARFAPIQKTVAKTLYVFAQVNERYPEALRPTLEKYSQVTALGEGGETGVAIGMLEFLYNMNLMRDPRFSNLSKSLRDIAIEDLGSVEEVQGRYSYRVTRYTPFWLEGETALKKKRSTVYGREKASISEEDAPAILLPETDYWDSSVRKIAEDRRQIAGLTPANSISRVSRTGDRSLVAFSADMRETLRKRSELIETLRLQGEKLPSELRRRWVGWLNGVSAERKVTSDDSELMGLAARTIMRAFSADKNLSRKSAGLIDETSGPYRIDPSKLINDPLFNWIFALRDETFASRLEKAAATQPAEFSLLLRLMTYESSHKFFRKREGKFLFDPRYKEKANPDDLVNLIRELRALVNGHKPDIKQILLETILTTDAATMDLTNSKRIKQIEKNLRSLRYEEPMPLVRIDKSRGMLRRDFLKTLAYGTLALEWYYIGRGLFKTDPVSAAEGAAPISGAELLEGNTNGFFDEAYKRVPEGLSVREVERLKPFFYGRVLNLPEKYFPEMEGERVGFFAAKWGNPDGNYFDTAPIAGQFEPVNVVDSIADLNPDLSGFRDSLIIQPEKLTKYFIPPTGWKVSGILQEKGAIPLRGFAGEIYFLPAPEDPPVTAIIAMTKIPDSEMQFHSPGITTVSRKELEVLPNDYSLLRPERAYELNKRLSKDPELQRLHKSYIDEMVVATGDLPFSAEAMTEVATKYAKLYEVYTRNNRHYSLGFSVQGKYTDSDSSSLEAIANSPDEGYYCEVASRAFREFMSSGGIAVFDQPGFHLNEYQDQLWGRVSHQNSVVALPDRSVMFVDVTPPVTKDTPEAHLRAMRLKDPGADARAAEDRIVAVKTAAKYGVGAGAAGVAILAARGLVTNVERRRREAYIDRFLSDTRGMSEIERDVLAASVDELAFAPYDQGFYDQAARTLEALNQFSPQKHNAIIGWLVTNQAASLHEGGVDEAYNNLVSFYHANRYQMEAEFEKSGIAEVAKSTNRPFDFDIAFEIARKLEKLRVEILKRDVYERLGLASEDERVAQQARFKAEEILNMIKDRLFDDAFRKRHSIGKNSSAYYQALYNSLLVLEGKGEQGTIESA